jgi:hypothetical protein
MTMRRFALGATLSLLTLPLIAAHGNHSSNYGHGLSVSFNDWDDVRDCSALHVRDSDRTIPVIEDNVPVGNLRSLKVHSDRNGGIRVTGNSGSTFSVRACKASALGNVNDLRVRVSGNEVSSTRGDDDHSGDIVYFLVSAPRGASVDLDATNGPISVDDVNGTVTARALNGPIAVKNSAGTLDINTTNGPIAFDGNSGNVKLRATNGPIAVKLAGASWTSGKLDASTENGPLSLKVPRNYGSGVLVETDGNSPVTCRGAACAAAKKAFALAHAGDDEDDDSFVPRWPRRLEFGAGARAVSLSTHNGPVAVREE